MSKLLASDPELPRLLRKICQRGEKDCWLWTGWRQPSGHGQVYYRKKLMPAHRAFYMATSGQALGRFEYVCHRCDNPPCCNPAHLFVGTQKDNMRGIVKKGRHVSVTHPESFVRGSASHLSKLNENQVSEIFDLIKSGMGDTEIFKTGRFPISVGGIFKIRHRKTWRHYEHKTTS